MPPSAVCVARCAGATGRPSPLCNVPSIPPGPVWKGEAQAAGQGEWMFPGVLVLELCCVPRNIPTFPFLGRNIMSTGSSPACRVQLPCCLWAAGRFLTRTRSIQGAKPWGQSGRETHWLSECQQQESLPRSDSSSLIYGVFAMRQARADYFTWINSFKPPYGLGC